MICQESCYLLKQKSTDVHHKTQSRHWLTHNIQYSNKNNYTYTHTQSEIYNIVKKKYQVVDAKLEVFHISNLWDQEAARNIFKDLKEDTSKS